MKREFQETIDVTPALITLEALLPNGLNSLPRRVRKALERDDYSAALSAANRVYSTRGANDRDAAVAYAVLLVGRELIDEAMGVLQRALTHHAQDVSLQLAQVEALVMKGSFESASELLDGMRTVSTTEPRHWSFIGDMYLDMGEHEKAAECYRQALERGQKSADIAYRLAQLSSEQDDRDGAAHYLEMAARLAGDNPALWQAAAEACYEVERVDDAVYAFEQMLQEQPYDEQAWFMLGLSYWYLDRFQDAARAFEEVVELNPRHRIAWGQLGEVWLTTGHGEKALHAFRKALDLKSDDVDVLNGAVMAAYQTGDVQAAVEWAQRAVGLAPEDRQAQYNYGVILLALGRGDDARKVLEPLVENGEGEIGTYLGALAVAEMMSGRETEAFEHIGEAERLEVEPQWLAAFAEELLKIRGAEEAMDYLDRAVAPEPTWKVIRPLLGYICSGLAEDDERASEYARRFHQAVKKEPQVVPVLWDFESWEAFAFQLEQRFERVFDTLLAIVEGRQEIEEIEQHLN